MKPPSLWRRIMEEAMAYTGLYHQKEDINYKHKTNVPQHKNVNFIHTERVNCCKK
jgi:hypothetical protein